MSVNWNSSQEIPKPSYTQTEYTHCERKPLGSGNANQNRMLFALPNTSVTKLSHRQVFANRMTTGTCQVWGRWPQIAALGALPSSGDSPGQGMGSEGFDVAKTSGNKMGIAFQDSNQCQNTSNYKVWEVFVSHIEKINGFWHYEREFQWSWGKHCILTEILTGIPT